MKSGLRVEGAGKVKASRNNMLICFESLRAEVLSPSQDFVLLVLTNICLTLYSMCNILSRIETEIHLFITKASFKRVILE